MYGGDYDYGGKRPPAARQMDLPDAPAEGRNTPIVVDGVMFVTRPPSDVIALDAGTGRALWTFEYKLPGTVYVCCGEVNRMLLDLVRALVCGAESRQAASSHPRQSSGDQPVFVTSRSGRRTEALRRALRPLPWPERRRRTRSGAEHRTLSTWQLGPRALHDDPERHSGHRNAGRIQSAGLRSLADRRIRAAAGTPGRLGAEPWRPRRRRHRVSEERLLDVPHHRRQRRVLRPGPERHRSKARGQVPARIGDRPERRHCARLPAGPWHRSRRHEHQRHSPQRRRILVASVYDGREFRNYVDGVREGAAELDLAPHRAGHASVGVRINKVYYFKRAVLLARFTRRALSPSEFLAPPAKP